MSSLDATTRSETLDRVEDGVFDLAIIGGGITGAGVAREASMRGLRVALLEAEDFASGTSSRSSKLVHGGLRYLAMGDVALVRETALERKVLHRMAPHLAERRWMVLPVRSRAGLLKFRTAITTYEKLGAVEEEDRHRNWDATELEREEPLLDRQMFPYACAYREYLTDDARLVIANLRAADAAGAVCLGHAAVTRVLCDDTGVARGVQAECALSGRLVEVRARCTVNAAGPWVEAIRRLEQSDAPSLLHLSKGVHVSFPRTRLPIRNVVLLTAADKRSLFAIPRGEVTYVGTTDTSYGGDARIWPEITSDDVEYLIAPLSRYFGAAAPGAADIVSAWAGLRPLVARPGKSPQDLSRKDEVGIGPAGVVTVAGGKLTGYRPMAIRILEVASASLGSLPERPADEPPLPGGDFDGNLDSLAAGLADRYDLSPPSASRLAALYGTDAAQVLGLGRAQLVAGADVVVGEVLWAISREGAARVEDVLYRRTRAALYEPRGRLELAEAIAEVMSRELDWSPDRGARELERVRAVVATELAWRAG